MPKTKLTPKVKLEQVVVNDLQGRVHKFMKEFAKFPLEIKEDITQDRVSKVFNGQVTANFRCFEN